MDKKGYYSVLSLVLILIDHVFSKSNIEKMDKLIPFSPYSNTFLLNDVSSAAPSINV